MSPEVEDAGVSWELLDGHVTMDVIPREEGDLRVRFRDSDDDVLWSAFYERGFWQSRTDKGEIGNKLAKNTSFAKGTVKEELQTAWTDLTENSEEYEQELVAPSVDELLANTEDVEVWAGGEEREVHVYIEATPYGTYADEAKTDGGQSLRKLVFSNSEWAKSDGDTQTPPVVEKYSNSFFKVLDISWQEWRDDIRPQWEDMQEVVADSQLSTADRIAKSVVRSLRRRLDVHADDSKILNDSWNGWYDTHPVHGDVIWVPGETLDEAMDKHDKGTDYRSQLSQSLKSQGYTVASRWDTTIEGDPVLLYPFLPDVLGVQEIDVIGADSEDDDGDDDSTDGDAADADSADDDAEDSGREGADNDTELLDAVVDLVEELDPMGEGVPESEVVAKASTDHDLGPPDTIVDAIERAVLDGLLYRPEEDKVAIQPDDGGDSGLDTDEDGVPEP